MCSVYTYSNYLLCAELGLSNRFPEIKTENAINSRLQARVVLHEKGTSKTEQLLFVIFLNIPAPIISIVDNGFRYNKCRTGCHFARRSHDPDRYTRSDSSEILGIRTHWTFVIHWIQTTLPKDGLFLLKSDNV